MKKWVANTILVGASLGLTGGGSAMLVDGLESGVGHSTFNEAIGTDDNTAQDILETVGAAWLTMIGGGALVASGIKASDDIENHLNRKDSSRVVTE